jgi:hypothetical protein
MSAELARQRDNKSQRGACAEKASRLSQTQLILIHAYAHSIENKKNKQDIANIQLTSARTARAS